MCRKETNAIRDNLGRHAISHSFAQLPKDSLDTGRDVTDTQLSLTEYLQIQCIASGLFLVTSVRWTFASFACRSRRVVHWGKLDVLATNLLVDLSQIFNVFLYLQRTRSLSSIVVAKKNNRLATLQGVRKQQECKRSNLIKMSFSESWYSARYELSSTHAVIVKRTDALRYRD